MNSPMSVPLSVIAGFVLYVVLTVPIALAIEGCKTDHETYSPEGATDGKALVKGCVWFHGGDGADTIAFCDDGRVCVKDGGWHCVAFAQPAPTCPATAADAAPSEDGR